MQWLNSEYATWFNRKYDRTGHLFQGRFKGILVDSEEYLLTLSRYVVMNPVRAGMVTSVAEYRWSSWFATAGLPSTGPLILSSGAAKLLSYFHRSDLEAAQGVWRDFTSVPVESIESPWGHLRNQIYLGSEAWIAKIQERIDEKARSADHPKTQRHVARPRMDAIVRAVAKACEVRATDVRTGHGGIPRMLSAYIGVYDGVHFRRTIAAELRLTSYGRVSDLVTECRRELERDPELRRLCAAAREHLDNRPPPTPYVLTHPMTDLVRDAPAG